MPFPIYRCGRWGETGLKKGSVVMLILRRRWEYWVCATALIKLGVIFIPGTLQLTKKDIAYRANAANVEMCICVNDDYVVEQMELAKAEMPQVKFFGLVGDIDRDGWFNFNREFEKFSDEFLRPTDEERTNNDNYLTIMNNFISDLSKVVLEKK